MAEKIEWHSKIPNKVKWLTFANQSGYTYNNDYTEITAYTYDNRFPDKIKFVVDYNSSADNRTCAVKFTQKGGKTITCHISQDGTTTFENFWKHAPKGKTPKTNPTDAVIAQSHNETSNEYEVAVGDYNRTRDDLLFSVGSGDENNRKNSFEVDNEKISADKAYISNLTANTLSASTIENGKIQSDKADINSLTADTITVKDKIKADKADISHLTANTFSATTICATTIVNESGTNFDFGSKVSYTAATKSTDANSYKIGTLKIDDKTTDIYGIKGSGGGSTGGSGDGTYPKDAEFDSITAGTLSARTITADEGHFNDLKTTEFSATSAFISALTAAQTTTEYLDVTKEAHFKKVIIDEVKSVGGQIILSCANAIIDKVEQIEGKNEYKLSWLAKDGKNRELDNQFEVNDYVVCQNFDAKQGVTYDVSNKYYWRKCLSASTETIGDNKYNYIIIEGADGTKGKGQGIPNVGDNIAQLGHVGGGERANAIVLSAYQSGFLDQGGDAGDGVIVPRIKAPSIVQYANIGAQKNGKDFSWNLFPYRYTVISNGLNLFRGKFIVQDGGTNDGANVVDLIAKVASGAVTYVHVAYANSSTDWARESQIKDSSSPYYNIKDWQYIGFNSSFDKEEPTNYDAYTWTKYRGEAGASGEGTKLLPIQEDIVVEQTTGPDGNIIKKIKASLAYRLVKVAANGYEDLQFDNSVSVKIYKGNNGNQETEEATYFTGAATEDKKYYKISGGTYYDKNLQYYAVECVNSKNEVIDHRLVYVTMPTDTIFEVTDSAVTISQQASKDVRDLAKSAITYTNFENEYNRCASGLTNSFSSFTTNFNSYSGNVEQEITNVNTLVTTASSNTLTLSGKVTTYYDTLNGKVSANTKNINTLSATSTTFLSKLDSISIGSVNLLYDTLFENIKDDKFVYWSTWGSPSTCSATTETDGWSWLTIKSTSNNSGLSQNSNNRYTDWGYCDLKPNSYYTFSFYAYGDTTHADVGVEFISTDSTHEVLGNVWSSGEIDDVLLISKSWKTDSLQINGSKSRYWFTFKTPDNEKIGFFNAMIGFCTGNGAPADTEIIHFAKPQLEQGTIPTDWEENNDYSTKKMSSKIEQTASSITLSVQENVENKLVETGIDIKNKKITLKADNTNIEGDLNLNGTFRAGSTEYNCTLKTIEEPTVNDQGQQVKKGTSGLYSYNKNGGYLEFVQDANGMSYGLMEIKQTAGEGTVMGTTKIDYFDIGIGLGSDTISYGSLKVSEIFNGEGDMPSNLKPIDIKYAKVTPSYQKFTTTGGTISALTQNVICKNTTDITLTLPSNQFEGTEIRIWKFGSNVTLTSPDYNILQNTNNGSGKAVTLNKTYALYFILFDGEDWLLTTADN